jgi:ABC-type multidrug transport system fused ATPase/permease subunit
MRQFPHTDLGTPDQRSPLRYLLWLVGRHRASIVLATVYGILCALAQALVPLAVGRGIDTGLIARDQDSLVVWSAAVLLLGLVQAVTGTLRDRASVTNRYGATYLSMQLVTRQATRLGATLPKRMSAGEMMGIGSADLGRIGFALETTARGSGALVSIVVVAVLMTRASWQLGLVVLAGVPAMAWAITRLMRQLHGRQQELRSRQGHLAGLALDIVNGLRVLRGIGGEEVFVRRYRGVSQQVRRDSVQVAAVDGKITAAKILLPGLLTTGVVWLGAHYVATGQLSAGALVSFYGYTVFLADQLSRVTTMVDQLTRAHVSAGRVVDMLDLEPEFRTEAAPRLAVGTLVDPESGIVVPAGRFVAVVCTAHADNALLADRLGRYADSGTTYGGVPLADASVEEIRTRILVAGNESHFFSGALRTELDPRDRAVHDDRILLRALDDASARDILDGLPDGLDTVITGAGREFSGGQQQRLRLVRALMYDPEVLVLVEPTNAVDAHTEARIARRLTRHRAGDTTLLFTTSPTLLDQADEVVLVQDGRVTATGTHDDMLSDPRYRGVVTREVAGT